jgi:hypothetical protein
MVPVLLLMGWLKILFHMVLENRKNVRRAFNGAFKVVWYMPSRLGQAANLLMEMPAEHIPIRKHTNISLQFYIKNTEPR